jgi:hypothetical protein
MLCIFRQTDEGYWQQCVATELTASYSILRAALTSSNLESFKVRG